MVWRNDGGTLQRASRAHLGVLVLETVTMGVAAHSRQGVKEQVSPELGLPMWVGADETTTTKVISWPLFLPPSTSFSFLPSPLLPFSLLMKSREALIRYVAEDVIDFLMLLAPGAPTS